MKPVVTLTLSPSLDIATQVPRLYPDAKLRCEPPLYAPGGGGINVARAIHILGGSALALYPAGGSTGLHLSTLLDDSGVPHEAIPIEQWTRESLNLTEQSSARQYRLIMPGARLSSAEQTKVLSSLQALADFDYLVISGSLSLLWTASPASLRVTTQRGLFVETGRPRMTAPSTATPAS